MEYQEKSTTKKKKVKRQMKHRNSEPESAEPTEDGHNYIIDWLNIGETAQDSDSDSKWLITQHSKIQMKYKNNSDISNKHECNVPSNF